MGVVLERKLYVTRIKTYKNQIITIPNGNILNSHVTNLSHEAKQGDGLILHTQHHPRLRHPWETIHALLIDAAVATRHILKSPPPFVLQTRLNDFYVTYELNTYTDAPGDHASHLRGAAPEHPEQVQRIRRGNPVTPLHPSGRQPDHLAGGLSAPGLCAPGHPHRQHHRPRGKEVRCTAPPGTSPTATQYGFGGGGRPGGRH